VISAPVGRARSNSAPAKKGDVAGGDADITAVKAIKPDVADWHAKWGVSEP
jgi:hypothetical protein